MWCGIVSKQRPVSGSEMNRVLHGWKAAKELEEVITFWGVLAWPTQKITQIVMGSRVVNIDVATLHVVLCLPEVRCLGGSFQV